MEMPHPSADHDRLELLCGDWRGTETIHPSQWDPNGGEVDAHTVSHRGLGGFVVVSDYVRAAEHRFEGHGIYTWDAAAGEVVLHFFDNTGQGREEFRGTWQGKRLALTSHSPDFHMRVDYDFSHAGEMRSTMDISLDGANWSRLVDGVYRRSDGG